MIQVATEQGFSNKAFDAFLETLDEPSWLIEQRRDAWNEFCRRELPNRSEEEWMRTDIRLFKLDRYSIPHSDDADFNIPEGLLTVDVDLAGSISSLNGQSGHGHLDKRWSEQGVVFGSLRELVRDNPDLLRRYLFSTVDPDNDKFSALHAACWTSGSVLYVPRGVVVDQPLHSLAAVGSGGVDLSHTLVILDEGAEATVLTETASAMADTGGLHCGATELIVGPGAHLRFVSLQNWDNTVWHFAHQKAAIDRDASLQWTVGALGSRLAKVNQHVALKGSGASCQVNGTMFTEGKQHLSYHTLQHHVAESCRSDFLYKAALQDKSRTVWRGMIKVDSNAQKTDGYQRNDNLLLSAEARADAIPGLEIEADDVRCTHGATTGRVDEEMVFYAQCRGFTRREATRMIVTGFFQQIFDRIPLESVRNALGLAIARRVREYE